MKSLPLGKDFENSDVSKESKYGELLIGVQSIERRHRDLRDC